MNRQKRPKFLSPLAATGPLDLKAVTAATNSLPVAVDYLEPATCGRQAHGGLAAGGMAATMPQRERPHTHLHHRDFSHPVMNPGGSQRLLRCETVDGELRSAPTATARDRRRPIPWIRAPDFGDADDGGIEELREKLLGHLREAADRMNLEMPQIGPEAKLEPMPSSVDSRMPWSLRTKRAVHRAPAAPAIPATKAAERTVRLRSEDPKKKELQKFSVALSRDEIEEDVFALTGSRPCRRPRKRPRIVQRQLDAIFPGLCLSEISPESYRVPK